MHPKALLFRLWLAFSTTGTIISFASLTSDIFAWVEFIRDMIAAYRDVVDAVWGTLFRALQSLLPDFRVARWVHDYLTLTSLMSASIVWALHATSVQFGWGGLGSVLGVIKNSVLDVQVGGNILDLFGTRARAALLANNGQISPEAEQAIARLSRPEIRPELAMLGVLCALAIVASLIVFPLLILPLLRSAEIQAARRSPRLVDARVAELSKMELNVDETRILAKELQTSRDGADGSEPIARMYHDEIAKQILYYYIAVFVGFGMLVFANYLFKEFAERLNPAN